MNTRQERPGFFIRHPWLFVVFAFLLLLGAWGLLITIAVKNAPQTIEFHQK